MTFLLLDFLLQHILLAVCTVKTRRISEKH